MPPAETTAVAVVDASVAVKWVVDEPDSNAAATLLERPICWIAPRLMLVEAAATLRRKAGAPRDRGGCESARAAGRCP